MTARDTVQLAQEDPWLFRVLHNMTSEYQIKGIVGEWKNPTIVLSNLEFRGANIEVDAWVNNIDTHVLCTDTESCHLRQHRASAAADFEHRCNRPPTKEMLEVSSLVDGADLSPGQIPLRVRTFVVAVVRTNRERLSDHENLQIWFDPRRILHPDA